MNGVHSLTAGLDDRFFLWRELAPTDSQMFVVFSCRGTKAGSFGFYKIFDTIGKSVLHVTDPDPNGWYQAGLPGLGDTPEAAFLALWGRIRAYIANTPIEEIVVVGTSMGGYASMLFASLGARMVRTRVITFATELVLSLPGSRSKIYNPNVRPEWCDLRRCDFSGIDITMVFGEFEMVDVFCNLSLKHLENVRFIPIASADHFIPEAIDVMYGMANFIKDVLAGRLYFPRQGHIHLALDAADVEPLVFGKSLSPEYMDAIRACLAKYPGFGFGWNRMGVHWSDSNRLDQAERALHTSLAINPNFANTTTHLEIVRNKKAAAQASVAKAQSPTVAIPEPTASAITSVPPPKVVAPEPKAATSSSAAPSRRQVLSRFDRMRRKLCQNPAQFFADAHFLPLRVFQHAFGPTWFGRMNAQFVRKLADDVRFH